MWLAWPDDGGGPVAIKRPATVPAGPGGRSDAPDRLRAEGEVLGGVDHPNLVAVLGVVEGPAGVALVLPHLPGGSLRDLLDERGTLGAGELLGVVAPVADALGALSDRAIVHGDCKPENVLFEADGTPVLIDAGAARPVGACHGEGPVVGTPDYLDPSLVDGGPVTPASDVYSLGVLAYEALTGRRPHRGEPAEVLAAAAVGARRPLASWPTVDDGVARVVERAMAPDPTDRPPDPRALADELRLVVPARSVRLPGPARTDGPPRRPGRLDTVRVAGPAATPPSGEVGPRPRRVLAARAAVVAGSVTLAVWAGAERVDDGAETEPAAQHGAGRHEVGEDDAATTSAPGDGGARGPR